MAVTPRSLQAIKAAPLSSVIEASGAKLKRVGREFLTQCIWHDDTNPSLTVNDDKGFCFCHVCRQGGDAIDYLQQSRGVTWREAAEIAADILSVRFETDDEDPEEARRRKAAFMAALEKNEAENKRYEENLHDSRAGRIRQILKDRGITKAAAKEFQLGFAPSGFFAGRITVPIRDHRNYLVGWTGRACGDQPGKYKNSADSDQFQKKQLVFNEHRAREAAREAGSLVFVEGHLDVVSMWQAGIRNVVALQGTGVPEKAVLKRLSGIAKNFILCFDGDAGGQKAAEHFISAAGPMATAGEVNINVASLPSGQDPDEVIRSGGDLYHYLASAPSWLDWVIDVWAAALDKSNTAMVTDVEEKLRQLIDSLRSKALRTHYIDKAARVLSSSDKEADKLAKQWGNTDLNALETEWSPRDYQETRLAAERRLLRIYVHRPMIRERLAPLLDRIENPALRWLRLRLQELELYSAVDLTPHSVMSIVVVAEPHYMQQLRALVRPNVIIDDSEGVLAHLDLILNDNPFEDPNEPYADQPSQG